MTSIGTGRLRAAGLLLTALLLAVGMLSAMTPANAAGGTAGATSSESSSTAARTAARRVNYGAIALNVKTGVSGWSYDKGSKAKAKRVAKRHCKSRTPSGVNKSGCKPVVWVRNGCAAVAVRVKGGQIRKVGWGVAFTKKKAVRIAKRKVGKKAKLHTWMCTTRYR